MNKGQKDRPNAPYTPVRADASSAVAAASRPQIPILVGRAPGGYTPTSPTQKKTLIGGAS